MSKEGVKTVLDRYMNDEAFRAQVRQNPEAAIRTCGADLSEEEMAAVKNVDWSVSDEELHSRMSKSGDSYN